MATVVKRATIFGTRYVVIDPAGNTVKRHHTAEAACWHCFALNSQIASTRAANDAQWAGRC